MACIFCLYKSLIFNTYFRRFSLPEKNKSPAERNDGGLNIILLYVYGMVLNANPCDCNHSIALGRA